MPIVISATEAKNRFGEVIRRVYRDGETFIVERDGLPVVMIVPVREYSVNKEREARLARAVHAAAKEAEELGLTEEQVIRQAREIREEVYRERYGE